MRAYNSKEKRQARIQWLIANKELWHGFPDNYFELYKSDEFRRRNNQIISKMREDDLFSEHTVASDIRLLSLINTARKTIRENQ